MAKQMLSAQHRAKRSLALPSERLVGLTNSYLLLVKEICKVKPQYFNILNSSAASWQSPCKVKAHRQRKDRWCWIWGWRAKRARECL